MGHKIGLHITIFKEEFSNTNRDSYHEHVRRVIGEFDEKKVVLLDPDVGLAPTSSKAKAEHEEPGDVQEVWRALNLHDILVLYQHSFRSFEWLKTRKAEFAKACKVKAGQVGTWRAPYLANDVAFLFAEKVG